MESPQPDNSAPQGAPDARRCRVCGGSRYERRIYDPVTFQIKHAVLLCAVCDLVQKRN